MQTQRDARGSTQRNKVSAVSDFLQQSEPVVRIVFVAQYYKKKVMFFFLTFYGVETSNVEEFLDINKATTGRGGGGYFCVSRQRWATVGCAAHVRGELGDI